MVRRGPSAKGHTHQLVLLAGDVGDVHVVGGGGQILKLLAGEDIDGDDVDLGVTVLASLRGGHLDDLAGAALDDDVTVLPQGRALHGEGGRRAGVGRLEGNVVLYIVSVEVVFPGELPYREGLQRPRKRGGRKMRGSRAPQRAIGAGETGAEGSKRDLEKCVPARQTLRMEGWVKKRVKRERRCKDGEEREEEFSRTEKGFVVGSWSLRPDPV